MKHDVLILDRNHKKVIFQGQVELTNIEKDYNSGCPIADCQINGKTILVWKISSLWQGWK